jgi:hydroxyethylthiazole kinase-like uncharacterized protein yjeF
MMDEPAVGELVSWLLQQVTGPAFTLDAAAFTSLREKPELLRRHPGKVVVTPHSGEMAKFLGESRDEIDAAPLEAARRVAGVLQAVVAMKGASTHVVAPDGEACLSENGTVGLATSGSGDTLAGIISGLMARGTMPFWATVWAVYMHGEAGRRLTERNGTFGLLARELPAEIPSIMDELGRRPSSGV